MTRQHEQLFSGEITLRLPNMCRMYLVGMAAVPSYRRSTAHDLIHVTSFVHGPIDRSLDPAANTRQNQLWRCVVQTHHLGTRIYMKSWLHYPCRVSCLSLDDSAAINNLSAHQMRPRDRRLVVRIQRARVQFLLTHTRHEHVTWEQSNILFNSLLSDALHAPCDSIDALHACRRC